MSAVETTAASQASRRRFAALSRGRRRTVTPRYLPYLLIGPALLVLGLVILYPLADLVLISFQRFRARELISGLPVMWIGLDNYRYVVGQDEFRQSLVRTLLFTAVNVALTMGIGLAIALMLRRLGSKMRLLVTTS